jgi:hypothetical protein
MKPYRLSLLQLVPHSSAEERLNIGVAIFSPDTGEFACRVTTRARRATAAFPSLPPDGVRRILSTLSNRCQELSRRRHDTPELLPRFKALEDGLNALVLPHNQSLRWTSPRSGVCEDLSIRLDQVYEEHVGRFEITGERERVDDDGLWFLATKSEAMTPVLPRIKPMVVASDLYQYEFRAAWQNGTVQLLEPISLDYSRGQEIVEKANTWAGRLVALAHSGEQFRMTALITNAPEDSERLKKYDAAVKILRACDRIREVLPVQHTEAIAKLVLADFHV